jgi:hypothetical protein
MAAGFRAASLVPDLAAKFQAGQRHAAEQQMAQLKYQQEKQKADMLAAIAPELNRYAQAELAMKFQQLNNMAAPTQSPGSVYRAVVDQTPRAADPRTVDPTLFPGFAKTGTTTTRDAANLEQVGQPIVNPFGTPYQMVPRPPPVGIDPSGSDRSGDIMNYSTDGNSPSFAYDFGLGDSDIA